MFNKHRHRNKKNELRTKRQNGIASIKWTEREQTHIHGVFCFHCALVIITMPKSYLIKIISSVFILYLALIQSRSLIFLNTFWIWDKLTHRARQFGNWNIIWQPTTLDRVKWLLLLYIIWLIDFRILRIRCLQSKLKMILFGVFCSYFCCCSLLCTLWTWFDTCNWV